MQKKETVPAEKPAASKVKIRDDTLPQAVAADPAATQDGLVQTAVADRTDHAVNTPTPEESAAMLKGKNRLHFEGLGDAWAVLSGQNPSVIMSQIIGTVLHDGGTRPAWQWKRGGRENVFMAWPQDQPVRAGVLMSGEEGGSLSPATAVPLLDGLPNDLTVEGVHPWQHGLGANVSVNMIDGENPLWFFNPLYGRDRKDLTPGVTHTFLLAGLAYRVHRALLDEITITHGSRYAAYAASWLAENPGRRRLDVPHLKVNVAGRRLIMPGRHFCEYQVRAVVEEVQECMLEKMPVKLLYLSFPFDNREALRLPVYASQAVLGDFAPATGQEVDAYLWLQGRIIDIDGGLQEVHAT